MKMRIAFLIGFLTGAWGCGGNAVTNPQPPDVAATATPVPQVTPVRAATPQPTPQCTIHKLCDEGVRR